MQTVVLGTTLRPAPGSSLLGITSGELADALDWPPG
jgi:hypothetical protein